MGSLGGQSKLPPILDFSVLRGRRLTTMTTIAFRSKDAALRAEFLQELGQACRDKGFFQLTNHGVSAELQQSIFAAAKQLFDLPLEEKLQARLTPSTKGRGYETIGDQMLEPGAAPDTKEAIYLGEDLPADHPRVLQGEYGCGSNIFPPSLGPGWHETCMEYFYAMTALAQEVMRALACALDIPEDYFDRFTESAPTATLRLVHYPPTPRTVSDHEENNKARGCGAHRDFGCVTLLLQDQVGGLQVQDEETGEFLAVDPCPGAYVVNLGNLMARWTNHHYTSNTHRVMNFSPADRYSIPFFFSGNATYTLETIPGLEQRPPSALTRKFGPVIPPEPYGPVSVTDFLRDQFVQSYKRASDYRPESPKTVNATT
ncbi:putative 2OG-Fe(II) oxygenase family oxidoreductase [Fonsecaea pedrosoi]|nr:putative 2OG-Fe(II) oxygenase family oxidoreductase [Fonsecaea pedrosoi]